MEQLKQILYCKLRFMESNRARAAQTIQQKQKIAEQFLKQKKKQNSRDVIESRLLQTLSTRKIEAPYRIEEFYNQSLEMMHIFDPSFVFINTSSADGIASIVYLYIDFFHKQSCGRRAEQLKHIFQKNLCERNMIIPTIFNWFAEWLKKVYREFIKKNLHHFNQKAHSTSVKQSKRVRYKKFLQEISTQKASLAAIDTQIKICQELQIKANRSKLLISPASQIKTLKNVAKSDILNNISRNQSLSLSKINQNFNSSLLEREPTIRQIQPTELTKAIKDRPNINKNMFFSAFYEQMSFYYKFYSCLEQIDQSHYRNFRKIDRRDEISKNLDILAKSMARNQPAEIKNSVDLYYNLYSTKFGYPNEKKRSSSVKLKSYKELEQQKITKQFQNISLNKQQVIQGEIVDQNTSKLSPIKKRQYNYRVQAEKKKIQIQIQLPEIKPYKSIKSVQKIILVHEGSVSISRYNKGNKSARISAEIYKELRQINGAFKSRKRSRIESLSFDKSIQQRVNQIRFRKNEATGLLDGHFQADGIFRLPKINK